MPPSQGEVAFPGGEPAPDHVLGVAVNERSPSIWPFDVRVIKRRLCAKESLEGLELEHAIL